MISEFAGASANIMQLNSNTAWIEDATSGKGIKPRRLVGCDVRASDLRAGAALVLCALAAEGESTIENVSQIGRGYSKFWQKLANVGASITFEFGGEQNMHSMQKRVESSDMK
jgi:UDP-N-acetylglucosamine 1-carboxyvinyltransferase